MRTRRISPLFVSAGFLGATAACSAVLGITDFTPGDGGARDASTRDGTSMPGEGDGSGGDTCASDGSDTAVGCPCAQSGALGCNGHAQSQTLICTGGLWALRSTCPSGQNCDSRAGGTQGTCAPIDPLCTSATPNQAVCSNAATAVECGPDLVSDMLLESCSNQACINGACRGACVPNATQCAGNGVQTCGADGMWHATATCSESCSDGGCGSFPSCLAGGPGAGNDCGGSGGDAGTKDCCASFEVVGGTFDRSYDGVSVSFTNPNFPATVSSFRLDAYEATVGRFRMFVSAVVGGWRPDAGSGKHAYLNGGSGLANVGVDAGVSEAGWSMTWNSDLDSSAASWNSDLAACPGTTWTPSAASGAGSLEHRPINCVTWYEAYAFCIWDGGFLPSDAEWNYAASGGDEQRVYPWSSPPSSTTIDCAHANYLNTPACSTGPDDVGSESPAGDGKYGQADLAGNVSEWTLDSYAPYVTPCSDCSNVAPLISPVTRGGSFQTKAAALVTSYRTMNPPMVRDGSVGVRCARSP